MLLLMTNAVLASNCSGGCDASLASIQDDGTCAVEPMGAKVDATFQAFVLVGSCWESCWDTDTGSTYGSSLEVGPDELRAVVRSAFELQLETTASTLPPCTLDGESRTPLLVQLELEPDATYEVSFGTEEYLYGSGSMTFETGPDAWFEGDLGLRDPWRHDEAATGCSTAGATSEVTALVGLLGVLVRRR